MSTEEATQYVDLVVEKLADWHVISEQAYGRMTENQRHELAELLVENSEE